MLEKGTPDMSMLNDVQNRIALKDVIPNISRTLLFGKRNKEESKCPFAFLFKK